jgi:hypothetical protein
MADCLKKDQKNLLQEFNDSEIKVLLVTLWSKEDLQTHYVQVSRCIQRDTYFLNDRNLFCLDKTYPFDIDIHC